LVWQTAGAGRGYASPAVAGGRIYTLGDALSTASDKDEYLTCYSLSDGKQLWKAKTGPAWTAHRQESWQSSRSTPTIDGALVYVLTPHGELVCCQSSDGKEVWRKDLKKDFGGKKDDQWGYSESVLIDGEKVVCTPGGETATIVALNKQNGELIWKSAVPGDRGAGHASIMISEIGGTRVYVQSTGGGAYGIAAKDGKVLWTYPIDKTTAVIPTAIIRQDLVFFVAGYNRGGALLKQVPGPQGTVSIQEIYTLNTELSNKHGGVVLVGDYLYGDSDDKGLPYCAELMTGTIKWKGRNNYEGRKSASVIAGDGKLYIRYENGIMLLAEANPDRFVEISSFKIPDSSSRPSWAHPVIVDGKLLLREQDKIFCYNIRANQ
jgi:outer membrane protein assembly factor BamB